MAERAISAHWSHHFTVMGVSDEEGNRDPESFYHELHDYNCPRNIIRLMWVGHVPQRGLTGHPEGMTQMGRGQCR